MGKDLYVRHISPDSTEDDLRRLFTVSGKVIHIHMVKDAHSGQFVGCAYIKMSNDAEARDALVTLDGALLGDRTILVSEARPRKTASRPGKGRPSGGSRPQRGSTRRPG